MDAIEFKSLYERLSKNLEEITSAVEKPKIFENRDKAKYIEKIRYLFHSVTKSIVDIGHSIILEQDLRPPLNRADIFISLAEKDILLSSVVPGVKKAVLTLPKLNKLPFQELHQLIDSSIKDIKKCLDSFFVYFDLKDK